MIKQIKYISILLFLLIASTGKAQIFIDWNSQYHYLKGITEPSQPNTLWRELSFNSSGWSTGTAPFRYGDGSSGTLLSDMMNNYTTFYLRKSFDVVDKESVSDLIVSVDYDDGFIMWLNGEMILQVNAPDNVSYNQTALLNHESGERENFTIEKGDFTLTEGTNVVAVQGFNVSTSSSDFYLDIKIEGKIEIPETDKVNMDIPSGFYENPFTVELATEKSGEIIKYTLDGSDPRTSSTAITASSPANVSVNPNSTDAGR